ncbi:MAG: hypothetical protein ACRBCT_03805 [Alphaproteobacteria bacterium]
MRLIHNSLLTLGVITLTNAFVTLDAFAGGDAHHGEEIKGLPQLDFSTYTAQIFWLIIFFVLLYIFFSSKTLPEISSAIEGRREKVEGDLASAQDSKQEAEDVQGAYEASLAAAREKASNTFLDAETAMKAKRDEKLEAFKARADKLNGETEKRVDAAKAAAMDEAHDIAADVARAAAEKIVGISTDLKQAKTLVQNIDKKAA